MSEFNKLACGIRFLMAIGPTHVEAFFAKVRKELDDCGYDEDVEMMLVEQAHVTIHDSYTLLTVNTSSGLKSHLVHRKGKDHDHHYPWFACEVCKAMSKWSARGRGDYVNFI
jgi:hypothetical protein